MRDAVSNSFYSSEEKRPEQNEAGANFESCFVTNDFPTNPHKVYGYLRTPLEEVARGACPPDLRSAADEVWEQVVRGASETGLRNAQVTLLAPTGTIGLLMDCDTTGIEPDFALVKFKKLAGGGYFKIINQSVTMALERLGYSEAEILDIIDYIQGTSRLEGTPWINHETLQEKGLTEADLRTRTVMH